MRKIAFQAVSVMTVLSFSLFSISGCAGLVNGSTQEITITSNPSEANVSLEGLQLKTPGRANVSRKSSHVIKFEKEGYNPSILEIDRSVSWWVLLDALWGLLFFIPLLTDMGSGGLYAFEDEVHVNLVPTPEKKD